MAGLVIRRFTDRWYLIYAERSLLRVATESCSGKFSGLFWQVQHNHFTLCGRDYTEIAMAYLRVLHVMISMIVTQAEGPSGPDHAFASVPRKEAARSGKN